MVRPERHPAADFLTAVRRKIAPVSPAFWPFAAKIESRGGKRVGPPLWPQKGLRFGQKPCRLRCRGNRTTNHDTRCEGLAVDADASKMLIVAAGATHYTIGLVALALLALLIWLMLRNRGPR
jgi:hypothetical protein